MTETIDRAKARELMDDVKAALEAVAEKHGVSVNLGRGTFEATQLRMKLTLMAKGGERAQYERDAWAVADRSGISADEVREWYGQEFQSVKYGHCKVVALKPRATRMNVVVESELYPNHTVSFSAAAIKRLLATV